ncbi:S-adenosylmethionine:tRNA ribosyltransferase-isomerase [Cephaloticoccus primus]|uniref:S-adenosylmethionine:tRNA ribosyltransferase-isomerase n=1 Tax=Cephaloticoccus primus TaxID=1548207 RepID=A0A139SRP3_9BACT|nr:S-adenosylmethionine:tRNA ribosyltransferase-isomerase [Cephaloticoccus primus]
MPTECFDYALPEELIAQTPSARRDGSRLLVVDRTAHTIAHHHFAELPEFLRAGDTLFRNNAAVFPARLRALRPSGGQVECFLLRPHESGENSTLWLCLLKPGKRLPIGATFAHASGAFSAEVVAREPDRTAIVRFRIPSGASVPELARRLGAVPLPPYIRREYACKAYDTAATNEAPMRPNEAAHTEKVEDLARYQTVYADEARPVAVAAPTAGLHFTPELLAQITARGVALADLTLHVGLGTFRPITTDTINAHQIHHERYEIPAPTLEKLRHGTGRRIAVGTTSLRSIEHYLRQKQCTAADTRPETAEHSSEADLFIYPPATFRGVDALLTNFHQPRSTLLCLVAAFLAPGSTDGIAWLHEIYAEAIARRYRFFSYGDAMLIL